MSNETVVRIGLVGCGRIAERGYVPAFARAAGVRLAAVADRVEGRCERTAPGVPAFRSAAELVATGAAEALVLATPASAHLPDARVAAEARLPVLIEKPPAPTLAEARALMTLDPPPWVAFNRRFELALVELRAAIPDHGPLLLELDLRTRPRSWRAYESADDALLNLGPHLVDLARWLSRAEPVRVRGDVQEARALVELELSGGRGLALLDCANDRPYRQRVVARTGDRELGRHSGGGVQAALRAVLRLASANPLVPSLARQLEAFARVVRGDAEDTLASAADGIAVMATLEAARRSSRNGGRWEAIDGGLSQG